MLVQTLAENPRLVNMVQSLTFAPSMCAYVPDDEWARALVALHNLRDLSIAHHVPLDWRSVNLTTFQLRFFSAVGTVSGPWIDLLSKQSQLQEISLLGDYLGKVPAVALMPSLRRITGRADDIAKFAAIHPLESVVFWRNSTRRLKARDVSRFYYSPARVTSVRITCSQFITLHSMAPQFFGGVEHLVLNEDANWTDKCSTSHKMLVGAAAIVNQRQIPGLTSVSLVASRLRLAVDRRLRLDRSYWLLGLMQPSDALHTWHFCAIDGCFSVCKWGLVDETIELVVGDQEHDMRFFEPLAR
ncbi:hypothetical protein DFH07DRAFT_953162 [Mycena maculata]|uniref:Uncharacterized protein n=1 Tax=Mycena maculata TaxID=230809 RepID=A0AAD7NS81_9AGAR|nr:hypothetical protein DFH07DRAFT_953162 [Mycena maculata]